MAWVIHSGNGFRPGPIPGTVLRHDSLWFGGVGLVSTWATQIAATEYAVVRVHGSHGPVRLVEVS